MLSSHGIMDDNEININIHHVHGLFQKLSYVCFLLSSQVENEGFMLNSRTPKLQMIIQLIQHYAADNNNKAKDSALVILF